MLRHLLRQRKNIAEKKIQSKENEEIPEIEAEALRTGGGKEVENETDTSVIAEIEVVSAIDTAKVNEMTTATESKENIATTTIVNLLHGAMTTTENHGAITEMNTEDEIGIEKKTATTQIIVADRFLRLLINAGLAMKDTRPPQSTIEGTLRLVRP